MSKLRNVIHLWGAILEIWHSSQFVNFWQKINFGSELLAIEKWFWRWSWEITTTNIWIFKNLLKICGMNENLASVKLQSTHLGIYCWKVVELWIICCLKKVKYWISHFLFVKNHFLSLNFIYQNGENNVVWYSRVVPNLKKKKHLSFPKVNY